MNQGRIVFSQIMDFIPRRQFHSCVSRYQGDRRVRTFTCLDQFYCMSFAQLTGRESLRDWGFCRENHVFRSVYVFSCGRRSVDVGRECSTSMCETFLTLRFVAIGLGRQHITNKPLMIFCMENPSLSILLGRQTANSTLPVMCNDFLIAQGENATDTEP